jgi:hypothetical protein
MDLLAFGEGFEPVHREVLASQIQLDSASGIRPKSFARTMGTLARPASMFEM